MQNWLASLKVKIIKLGTCVVEAPEPLPTTTVQIKSALGIGGGSTVVLIETDRRVLIDTGFDNEAVQTPENREANRRKLVAALKEEGYEKEDIDAVFITHWHLDHYGNVELFQKAELLASQPLVKRLNLTGFKGVEDGEQIARDARVIFTPGHTADHASVIVAGEIRIVVAGDAIVSLSYFDKGKAWQYNTDFYSGEKAMQSMVLLARSADIIIPGHGLPFMSYQPAWLLERQSGGQSTRL